MIFFDKKHSLISSSYNLENDGSSDEAENFNVFLLFFFFSLFLVEVVEQPAEINGDDNGDTITAAAAVAANGTRRCIIICCCKRSISWFCNSSCFCCNSIVRSSCPCNTICCWVYFWIQFVLVLPSLSLSLSVADTVTVVEEAVA